MGPAGAGPLKDLSNLLPPSSVPMHRSTSLTNTASTAQKGLHRTKTTAIASKGSKYSGELSRSEVENGYGMGMASAGLLPSTTSTASIPSVSNKGGGLFSMVTGQSTATATGPGNSRNAGGHAVNNQLKKRSFSAMLHTGVQGTSAGASAVGGGGGVTKKRITPVSLGQQFVFMDTSLPGGGDTSRSHLPAADNAIMRCSSMSAFGGNDGAVGGTGGAAGESLFAKLGARSGGNNNNHSLKRSFTTKGN